MVDTWILVCWGTDRMGRFNSPHDIISSYLSSQATKGSKKCIRKRQEKKQLLEERVLGRGCRVHRKRGDKEIITGKRMTSCEISAVLCGENWRPFYLFYFIFIFA